MRFVGHEGQPPLGGDRVGDDVVAVDRDAPGGRPQNAGKGAERRRLAGAVGADEADDLAGARRRTRGRRRP